MQAIISEIASKNRNGGYIRACRLSKDGEWSGKKGISLFGARHTTDFKALTNAVSVAVKVPCASDDKVSREYTILARQAIVMR